MPRDRITRGVLARRVAYGCYAAAVVALVATTGVPTGRILIAVIVMTGLVLTSIGRSARQAIRVIVDWLPFSLVLMFYDLTRSVVDSLGVPLHEADILHAERWLFAGVEPTRWLQAQLYDAQHVHWYDAACSIVYSTHFIVTPALAAVLWLRNRAVWTRYISRVIAVSVAGLITYCVFPEAPPWLAAQDGLTGAVPRLSTRGWNWLHLDAANATLTTAQHEGSNPVAAMPSLHTALAVLAALFVVMQLRSRWRYLAFAYPLAMGFTLVYCGEHYVLDLLAGVGYAVGTHYTVSRWERGGLRLRKQSAQMVLPRDDDDEWEVAPAGAAAPVAPVS